LSLRSLCAAPGRPTDPGVTRQILSSKKGYRLSNPDLRRRRQFIEGLRAVAQFYEDHPEAWYDGIHTTLSMYIWGRKTREILAQTVRSFGQCTKHYDDTNITVSRKFSDQVTLSVFASRAKVCRRVILGTRILPARTVPASSEVYLPATTEEVVAWRCDPLLQDSYPPKRFLPPENKCVDPSPFST
jgi:hypothetical protein